MFVTGFNVVKGHQRCLRVSEGSKERSETQVRCEKRREGIMLLPISKGNSPTGIISLLRFPHVTQNLNTYSFLTSPAILLCK